MVTRKSATQTMLSRLPEDASLRTALVLAVHEMPSREERLHPVTGYDPIMPKDLRHGYCIKELYQWITRDELGGIQITSSKFKPENLGGKPGEFNQMPLPLFNRKFARFSERYGLEPPGWYFLGHGFLTATVIVYVADAKAEIGKILRR